MRKHFNKYLLILASCLLLFACRSTEEAQHKFRVDQSEIDQLKWQEGQESQKEHKNFNWLADFNDKRLEALVDKALNQNFSVVAASERIKALEARYRITRANNKPEFELGVDANRRRQNLNSGKTDIGSNYELSLRTRWEIDLWGRLDDLNKQANANYQASLSDLEAVKLSLAASISRAWFEALSLSEQVLLTKDSLQTFEKSQEIIEERYQRGITTALDVHLGRTNLANAKRELLVTQRQHAEAIRQLKILIGEYPTKELKESSKLPTMPSADIPLGLPSTLLTRRPDLIAARQRLDGTFYQTENVKKNLLPSLTLTARAGTSADQFSELFDADNFIANLAGQLIQPLYASGKLKAEQKEQIAIYQAELAEYSETVLNAFLEVENSLAAEKSLKAQETVQATATRESTASEELALDQYSRGVEDIITLLTAQRSTLTAKIRLAELKKNRLQNRVNIYLAIGGEFQIPNQENK